MPLGLKEWEGGKEMNIPVLSRLRGHRQTERKLVRSVVSGLPAVAGLFTLGSLVLTAITYDEDLAEHLLPLYPRFGAAQRAYDILEDRRYQVMDGETPVELGVLDIDDRAWDVAVDFLQSEISVRKSERTEPGPVVFRPPSQGGMTPDPVELPPIDFLRIKTIASVKTTGVIQAGPKPLTPPYRLMVFYPHGIPRRVYEFLSYKEFSLDLRQMLLEEVRFGSTIAASVAFLISFFSSMLKSLLLRTSPNLTATGSAEPAAEAERERRVAETSEGQSPS